MIKIDELDQCSGCGACASACPLNCIAMVADNEGFCYPQIEVDKCIECGKCEKICPIINNNRISTHQPEAFAAWNVNEDIRKNSSSGGIFTLLAEKILEDGGTVFGASFSKDYRSVQHIRVENPEDLQFLRGSKYLQSVIGDCYIQAKRDLESGRSVLFTGTPCQIGGLYAYLGKNYPQLYTQDIICHGVPSPKVWAKYLDVQEYTDDSKTKSVVFRDKQHGWKRYNVKFSFENGKERMYAHHEDLYMRGFLAELYLRPSCHCCEFKGLSRQADITLADFWGVNQVMPNIDDDKGISLIFVHSEKAKQLLESLEMKMKCISVSADTAVMYNLAAVSSPVEHPKRKYFFENLDKVEFPVLINTCLRKTLYKRATNLIRRILHKLKNIVKFGRKL